MKTSPEVESLARAIFEAVVDHPFAGAWDDAEHKTCRAFYRKVARAAIAHMTGAENGLECGPTGCRTTIG